MLVAPRGEEQEPVPVLPRDPLSDRERLAVVGQELERAHVRGQHGAHSERRPRGVGVDDRLRDRPLHRLRQKLQT